MSISKKLLFLLIGALFVAGFILLVFFLIRGFKTEERNRFDFERKKVSEEIEETADKKDNKESLEEVSVVFVGDIMLSRTVDKKMRINGFDYPFKDTIDFLNETDFAFGNLETAITEGKEVQANEMMFRADPQVVESLKNANFKVLSLANNHTPNFSEKGLLDTFKYLDEGGIQYVGAGKNKDEAYGVVYFEKNGIVFAFLAYNDSDVVPENYSASENRAGTALMDIGKMKEDLKEAREKADILIVSMHSGEEYTQEPNDSQKDFAHTAIDNGADLVIGHHPHVIQTAEKYKEKYIFYSLGNFVFDQMWSQETREGLIMKASFTKEGLKGFELIPVLIEDYAKPKILEEEEAQKILDNLGLNEIT